MMEMIAILIFLLFAFFGLLSLLAGEPYTPADMFEDHDGQER